MGTGNITKTDLYQLNNYVQNTLVTYTKDIFVETLREFFSDDSYYRYQRDEWGFPKTPDHTDLPPNAGLYDNTTTRLFIGEAYRYDVIEYPALLVRNAGFRSVPISMNREKESVQWQNTVFVDGYGNQKIMKTPVYIINAGAWEGAVTVDIESRSPRARDELVDLVSILFVNERFEELKKAGVVVKSGSPNIGSPSEGDDRNDKLFKQTINFEVRTEWRKQIPVDNIIEVINFCVDIGNLSRNPPALAPNLSINTTIQLVEAIYAL